jgi:hypothetical protein
MFFSPQKRLLGPPSLVCSGYWVLSWNKVAGGVDLTTHLHLVPRVRMGGAIRLFQPVCLPDVDTDNVVSLDCVQAALLIGVRAPYEP